MPEVTIYNMSGEAVDTLALDERVFGAPARPDLVHTAVVAQLAAKRAGTHSAKTRGEVSGGGRKPYRQKGTGRARQGSIVAPQWKGGGVTFPPKPRDYRQRIPRKVRRQALFSVWSDHVAGDSLRVVDQLALPSLKTRQAEASLKTLLAELATRAAEGVTPPDRPEGDTRPLKRARVRQRVLVMLGPDEGELERAVRNLRELELRPAERVSVLFSLQLVSAPYASVYDLVRAAAVITSVGGIGRVAAEFDGTAEAERQAQRQEAVAAVEEGAA